MKLLYWLGRYCLLSAGLVMSLLFALYIVACYSIDEATYRKQIERKIEKIKPETQVFIKHWDGTEFYVTFVDNPKDAQPDIIWVRVWGKILPMEKTLIKEIKKR